MSGNAFLFTKRRLTDDHYLAIALREARDMKKPPITMTNFWKHAESYDDVENRCTISSPGSTAKQRSAILSCSTATSAWSKRSPSTPRRID